MKITRLQSENIKRIIAVEIVPEGNIVEISGKNDSGKSSVLDSIWWALAGAPSHQPQPIRTGEDEAHITLELGDLIIKRQFKRDKTGEGITTKLVVGNADGAQYARPQEMLTGLLDALAFDPLAFANAKPEEQYRILRGFVTDVEWDAEELANKAEYDRRRDLNREVSGYEAMLASKLADMPVIELIDIEDIRERLRGISTIQQANATNQNVRAALQRESDSYAEFNRHDGVRIVQVRENIETLTKEIDTLETGIAQRLTVITQKQADMAAVPDPAPLPEADALQDTLEKAQAHNHRVGLLATARERQAAADALTKTMDARAERLRKAVEAADMPAAGLELVDGKVLLDGAPLEQAGTARKYRLSGAIMVRLNPKLRVVLVRNAKLLDEDGAAFYQTLADKHDFQFWMEMVDSTGEVGFYIEDGHLVETDRAGAADTLEKLGVDPATNESARMLLGEQPQTEQTGTAPEVPAQAAVPSESEPSPAPGPTTEPAPMTDQELEQVGQVDATDHEDPLPTTRQQGLTL